MSLSIEGHNAQREKKPESETNMTSSINAIEYQNAIRYVKGHLTATGPMTLNSVAWWAVDQIPGINEIEFAKTIVSKMANDGHIKSEVEDGVTYLAIEF